MAFNQKRKKAIVYKRHSAEDKQENSVEIQGDLIHAFAIKHNIEIIHEVADEGESGVTANRPGFKKLFAEWILNSEAPHFDYVLVFDVSRWGRFQNGNEAAYYEFQCNQRGAQVIYVDDGMPRPEEQFMTQIKVSIQRGMAAEYSKKLSDKVFYGSAKVSEQGYSAGGMPCYGMDRLLLDEQKVPVRRLKDGEHKAISNQRVTFIPKEDETNSTVKNLFDLFVNQEKELEDLVGIANHKYSPPKMGGRWNKGKLQRVLTNETYIGTRTYNKTRSRLKTPTRKNDREQWVVCLNAFPKTIEESVFWKAQDRLHWSSSLRWKRGIYTINKAWRIVLGEFVPMLEEAGLDKAAAVDALGGIPLLFAVTNRMGGISQWCFLLEDGMRKMPYVLGIGVKISLEEPMDRFFCIPISVFKAGGTCAFSEKDDGYKKYQITEEQFKEKVLEIAQKVNTETSIIQERDPLIVVHEPTT